MPTSSSLDHLLQQLIQKRYHFQVVTPLTHQRTLDRRMMGTTDLRDIFGWNLPFPIDLLPPDLKWLVQDTQLIRCANGVGQSMVRVAALGSDLFIHSPFPTTASDTVFFGPDTYRFTRFIAHQLRQLLQLESGVTALAERPLQILDMGCGSGAGGVAAVRIMQAHHLPFVLTLSDLNPRALELAAINASVAGVEARCVLSDTFAQLPGKFDLILCNPPYLNDASERLYRHGGNRLGRELSIRITTEALPRLTERGCFLLYTGVAMTDAQDPLYTDLLPILNHQDFVWAYEEIDPDVFGEELDRPVYATSHRIAVIGLTARRRRPGAHVI